MRGHLSRDVGDAEGLFELLDLQGTGEISKDEFTYGAAKLLGVAQSRDLFYTQTLVERIEAKLDTLMIPQFRGNIFPMPATQKIDQNGAEKVDPILKKVEPILEEAGKLEESH